MGCRKTPNATVGPEELFHTTRLKLQNGDLVSAFKDSEQAEAQFEHERPDWAWRFRVLEAEVLVRQGRSKEALAIVEQQPPPSLAADTVEVRRNITLGLASHFLQHSDQADKYLDRAEQLAAAGHPDLLVEVFQSKGTVAVLRNKFDAAKSSFRRALQLAREQKQVAAEANALGSLGLTYMREGHYGEAIDWYNLSLAISTQSQNRVQIAKSSGNLGWTYFQIGDFERSLSLFSQARSVSEEQRLIRDQLVWLTNIGLVYLQQKNYPEAAAHFQQALTISRNLGDRTQTAICLTNLALTAIATKDLEAAERWNREALELKRTNRDRASEFYSILNEGQLRRDQGRFKEAEKDFENVGRNSEDSSLRWQAQAELAKTQAAEGHSGAAETQFRKALTTIDEARSSLSKQEYRLSFLNTATEFYHDYIDFLISRGRIEDALAVAEHSRARTLAEGLGIKPAALGSKVVRPTGIARQQNAVILAYWLKPERSYLWAITPTKVALFPLAADSQIDASVQAYRKALTGPRDPLETASDSGRQLYEMLIATAQKLIPAKSRVIVIADGSLHGLNFETLLAPTPKPHYWIEDVTISNANSLVLLGSPRLQPSRGTKPNLLLIGNPVSASSEFPPLAQANEEIRDVGTHFDRDRQTVIDGAKATPAAYLASDPDKFSYIHFVAHGTASRLSPLDSAVVLSSQGDAYKLYARDIVEKPLNADLVTVSACYGSGSRAYSGEGLVGLSWAFLRAGAHNVVAALWEANDVSTPKLMDAMYSGISRGEAPATALHEAKLAMLHSDSIYRRPFYWAPFQLYVGSGLNAKPGLHGQRILARSGGS